MQRRHFIGLIGGLIPGLTAARGQTMNGAKTLIIQESPLAGFQYHHGAALWDQLAIGQPLHLVREPHNRFDPRAVRIDWQGHKLGYLPRAENVTVAQMLDRGQVLKASIVDLRKSGNPWRRVAIAVRCEVRAG